MGLAKTMRKRSITIVNFNTRRLLKGCLQSLWQYWPRIPMEVLVVDNACTGASGAQARKRLSRRIGENSMRWGPTRR